MLYRRTRGSLNNWPEALHFWSIRFDEVAQSIGRVSCQSVDPISRYETELALFNFLISLGRYVISSRLRYPDSVEYNHPSINSFRKETDRWLNNPVQIWIGIIVCFAIPSTEKVDHSKSGTSPRPPQEHLLLSGSRAERSDLLVAHKLFKALSVRPPIRKSPQELLSR
jgi:hypothetical protein